MFENLKIDSLSGLGFGYIFDVQKLFYLPYFQLDVIYLIYDIQLIKKRVWHNKGIFDIE